MFRQQVRIPDVPLHMQDPKACFPFQFNANTEEPSLSRSPDLTSPVRIISLFNSFGVRASGVTVVP